MKGRTVFRQHPYGTEVSRLDDVRAARADRGHGFDGDDVHQAAALPAVGFGERDAEQPLLRHELGDVPLVLASCARSRALEARCLFEKAHRLAELLLLGRQLEVHAGGW